MATIQLTPTKKAKVNKLYPNQHFTPSTIETFDDDNVLLLFGNFSVPDNVKFKKISNCTVTATYTNSSSSRELDIDELVTTLDFDTVTYYGCKNYHSTGVEVGIPAGASGTYTSDLVQYYTELTARNSARYGICYNVGSYNSHITLDTTSVVLNLIYVDEDVTQQLESITPTSGYIPKGSANRFSWSVAVKAGDCCYGILAQTSATLYYKDGTDGSWQSVSCGTNMYCELPANTFTEDEVQWYVTATTNAGVTLTSDTYTLSTEEALSTATALDPKDTVIDISEDYVFSWEHVISTGTAPTKSELQISTDGTTFTALATVNSSDTSVTIPANTITAGTRYWRVRTYNTDDAAGTWSDVASFMAVGAPTTPVVNVSNVSPRPTVTWQATGQIGYQISIDDEFVTAPMYGAVYSYVVPYYLSDGLHTISVRVQNNLGLWSQWGSVSLTVTHTEGSAITLTADVSDDVRLSWTTQGNYNSYIVYRDDVPVYKTSSTSYTDNFACGSYDYYVRGIYTASYDYGVSNTVSAITEITTAKITAISSVDWLELPYSDTSRREVQTSDSINYVAKYIAGTSYPFVEVGNEMSKSITIDVAFKDVAEELKLKALYGKMVCLKTIQNERVIGALVALSKGANEFYSAYRFTILNTYYDEEISI